MQCIGLCNINIWMIKKKTNYKEHLKKKNTLSTDCQYSNLRLEPIGTKSIDYYDQQFI